MPQSSMAGLSVVSLKLKTLSWFDRIIYCLQCTDHNVYGCSYWKCEKKDLAPYCWGRRAHCSITLMSVFPSLPRNLPCLRTRMILTGQMRPRCTRSSLEHGSSCAVRVSALAYRRTWLRRGILRDWSMWVRNCRVSDGVEYHWQRVRKAVKEGGIKAGKGSWKYRQWWGRETALMMGKIAPRKRKVRRRCRASRDGNRKLRGWRKSGEVSWETMLVCPVTDLVLSHFVLLVQPEPFFISFALYDAKEGCKISEDVHVDVNCEEVRAMISEEQRKAMDHLNMVNGAQRSEPDIQGLDPQWLSHPKQVRW